MKINPKSQKGAITLIVLVTMLFLTAFLMTMYIRLANKAGISAETTAEIAKRYNNIGDIDNKYGELVEDPNKNTIIPITNKEQLSAIGSNTYKEVNGKLYLFSKTGNYVLQDNIDLGGDPEDEDTWWTPLTDEFTGVLDGLGYTISGLYIDDDEAEEPQGLFGTLNGIVRNLNIENSSITGNQFVGAIAGINGEEALIENCYNKATVRGTDYVGGIAGLNAVNEEDSTIHGKIKDCKNTGNIIGDTHVTGGYFTAIDDNTNQPVNNVWSKTRTLTSNYRFISGRGNIAVIPKGFKVSANYDEQTIEEGLVIQDSDGNEFVWVPVIYTATGTVDSDGLDSGFKAAFYRSEWSNNERSRDLTNNATYIENARTDPTGKYIEMMQSVQANSGFYIGRYEAGYPTTENIRYAPSTGETTIGTNTMVVKRDCYPYIFVGWGSTMNEVDEDITYTDTNKTIHSGKGAVYLSKNMYTGTNYGVVSTLCYGVQWDTMLNFIKDYNHNVNDSTLWGNYNNNNGENWTITRPTAMFSINSGNNWTFAPKSKNNANGSILLTTGANDSFKTKNIYDIAGNVMEWTMEAYSTSSQVGRGGRYDYNGEIRPASNRSNYLPITSVVSTGFRPALYIKPTE